MDNCFGVGGTIHMHYRILHLFKKVELLTCWKSDDNACLGWEVNMVSYAIILFYSSLNQ